MKLFPNRLEMDPAHQMEQRNPLSSSPHCARSGFLKQNIFTKGEFVLLVSNQLETIENQPTAQMWAWYDEPASWMCD